MEFLQELIGSKELLTLIYSAIPVTELRATIPIAITVWHVPPLTALILAIIGNSIPIVFIILGLNKLVELAEKHSSFFKKILESIFKRTRRKTWQKLEKYGLIALFMFVAIPLPGTGAWTGSVAAWLFGFPLKKAFWPIFGGVIAAGIIVTILTVGATAIIT